MNAVAALAAQVGWQPACDALGVSRATVYRRRRPATLARPRPRPPRALTPGEHAAVVAQLHSPRFVDSAPREIYATLLDEGQYLCSPRTMYRVLAAADEVKERRNQLRHVAPRPELLATVQRLRRGRAVANSTRCCRNRQEVLPLSSGLSSGGGRPSVLSRASLCGLPGHDERSYPEVVRSVVGVAIWYTYLNKSKRVKATYFVQQRQAERTPAGDQTCCPNCATAYDIHDYRADVSVIRCAFCGYELPR